MIISRTPFRLSFFGGGTDYPIWYRRHGGTVLGCAIDKYCYLTCRPLPPFFEHSIRVVYSKIENRRTIEEIEHPAVRECLRYLRVAEGVEIHHDGDLPARGGIGSSSAFTVGLLNALHALQGRTLVKSELARQAIHLEQDVLVESVGSQDQVLTCYGGMNRVLFQPDGRIDVQPITLEKEAAGRFNDHLLLFYTGVQRVASEVAGTYIHQLPEKQRELREIAAMVEVGLEHLRQENYRAFGALMDEYWQLKKSLGALVSDPQTDSLYECARKAGAWGGKLVGAGGGGYFLAFAPPEAQSQIREALGLLEIPFGFDNTGSQIIFSDHQAE
ncbi:MAG: kinase [Candidatus Eremiobacteraeota bacterium]|nr:kinase [Candidatus Eremiobacteraeota bacterium]